MRSRIRHITVDCHDPYRLATFWAAVLGFGEEPDGPNVPGDDEALIIDPAGQHPGVLFVAVPEPKAVKNRVHLDLEPLDATRDITVAQVLDLGATLVDDRRAPDGTGWAVLADPEGNEFCIERSADGSEEPSTPTVAPGAATAQDIAVQGPTLRRKPDIHAADERTMLLGMLDWYREGVVAKVTGLSDVQARQRHVASPTTVIGLVKHLAIVEDGWFHQEFAGNGVPDVWADAPVDDPDWDFRSAVDDRLADLLDVYAQACDRSRAVCAGAALDDVSRDPAQDFTLRYAVVHMIEETARHLGHLDILRELTDGVTGD